MTGKKHNVRFKINGGELAEISLQCVWSYNLIRTSKD